MARLKDFDGAMDLLERRLKTITPTFLRGVFTDPDLDELRHLPRFKAMMKETQQRLSVIDPAAVSQ